MRRLPIALVLVLGCGREAPPDRVGTRAPAVVAAATYEILLDGEAALEPDAEPAPGRVFYIGGYWIALGPPDVYHFRTEGSSLYLEQGAEDWKRVAVRVGLEKEGDEFVVRNPLAEMTAEEVGGLLGVDVGKPVEGLDEKLTAIDPERCVVSLWFHETAAWGRVPVLPAGLRHLSLSLFYVEGSEFGEAPPDLGPLRALTHLRWFNLSIGEIPFDLALLSDCREVEFLDLDEAKVFHPEVLGRFPRLRVLKAHDSRLRDLTPLSGHENLEAIHADGSRVEKLPKGRLPALRELHVMGAEVSDAEAAAFRAANPQCRVFHTWDEIVASRLEGATRVRVLDGACEPSEKDRLFFEVDDAAEVHELVSHLAFDNRHSGGYCLCGNGDIALVFSAGDEKLDRMGVKHMFTDLLWEGNFPAQGQLTEESADSLAEWLARHGFDLARKARAEMEENYGPATRRQERYESVLPSQVMRSVEGDWDEEVLRAFAAAYPEARDRARVYLELLGVDEGSWRLLYGMDADLIDVLLPSLPPGAVARAALDSLDDPIVLRGAARWLLGERRYGNLDEAALRRMLPAVGRHALASPRESNRERAAKTLEIIGGPVAAALLEEAAAGGIEPRPLSESDPPGGYSWKASWAKDGD